MRKLKEFRKFLCVLMLLMLRRLPNPTDPKSEKIITYIVCLLNIITYLYGNIKWNEVFLFFFHFYPIYLKAGKWDSAQTLDWTDFIGGKM